MDWIDRRQVRRERSAYLRERSEALITECWRVRENAGINITNAQHAQLEFIRLELRLASLMLERASSTPKPEIRLRNIRNACRAYDVIVDFLKRRHVPVADLPEVKKQLEQLRAELVQQGEVL